MLTSFFCDDNIAFTVGTDPSSLGTRTYTSFSAAAAEAGISRVYGGLHFPFSNSDGLAAGKAVAREILNSKLLLLKGESHFGQCPL